MRKAPEAVSLRDGSQVTIRPIEATDRQFLKDAFERLSPESRYRRFLQPMSELTERDLTRLSDVDHRDHEALIALDAAGERLVGVARYVRESPDAARAEAAVAVVDDWQGRGLGSTLLDRLVDRARSERITHFTALVLSENRRAVHLLSSLGDTRRSLEGPQLELEIALPPAAGAGAQLATALRAAAGGTLVLARASASRVIEALRPERPDPASLRRPSTAPIVVGTDGSQAGDAALRHGAGLARVLGAPLHVVAAYRRRPLRRDRPPRSVAALLASVRLTLAGEAISVETHARPGEPSGVLVELAADHEAQLIVIGSRQASLGSVPNRVVHHAPCNVLVVREAAQRTV